MTTKCPHCGGPVDAASLLGQKTSPQKAAASRANGKKGGRPKRTPEALEVQERDKEVGR